MNELKILEILIDNKDSIEYINIDTNYGIIIYYILIPIICLILLLINILLSESNNYSDKTGPFECGLLSFNQTRIAYSTSFILIALLFLPFDIEVTSLLPYALNAYNLNAYGLITVLLFILILTIGFYYEFNNNALYVNKSNIKFNNNYYLFIDD